MKYNTISADCHVDIHWFPEDMFVANVPSQFKDKVPKLEETSEGKVWKVDGQVLSKVAAAGTVRTGDPYKAGISKHADAMASTGFYTDGQKGLYHPTNPDLRRKDQELDGIDAEVIYGLFAISTKMKDPDALAVAFRIYNEWIADFCKSDPSRVAGLACLPNHDPQVAAEELARAAKMGLRGGELGVATAVKPIYYEDWDVLWAASDQYNMPLSFHTTGLPYRKPESGDEETYHWVDFGLSEILFQLSGSEFLTSIILSGACERYPNFKFVLGECGISWIPYVLERMDVEYDDRLFHIGLKNKPSDYWYRQGFSTFQHESPGPEIVSRIGENNIMWGSDYPHPDGVWPYSQRVIKEDLGHLDANLLRKITCTNAASTYRFR
jgi:predicted TIM-barrel fold metal-dependent hydrolase